MASPFATLANPPLQPVAYQPPPVEVVPPDGGLFPVAAPPPKPLWKGTFEAGVNGATGNTEVFNARLFTLADRKTDTNLFHTDATYLLGKQEGATIQNTAIVNIRDEILFPGSPWSIYGMSFIDYDELRDYKFYIGLYGGLGYLVRDDESLFFKLRAGAGTLYKTGGPSDIWEPSLNLGYDFKWRIGARSAWISTLDYYPAFGDFTDFLLRFRVAYETTLNPENGMFFRIGVFERYDSSPGAGFRRSDLNYFAALGFNF
jgi:hypothetical protein